jgi:PIN domain nuclease of toxin-antitoxin system
VSLVMIDTHVAVALFKGRVAGFSKQAQRLLDSSTIRYSPMVTLELELLCEIGRARVDAAVVCQYLQSELDVGESQERLSDIVRHAIPLRFTRDPFDRLIVAHADLLRAPLITLDAQVHRHYARALN